MVNRVFTQFFWENIRRPDFLLHCIMKWVLTGSYSACGSNKDHYYCNNGTNVCVVETKVCDGYKDCDYGEDEYGCEFNILT